ncbi:hypothetical protein C5U62_22955 [Pseudomonas protegens]|uniref:Uncharacterized protein n=2 Tax=Pseudomonas protegens TaxID=380021 RepID=A0A2T6GH75_9PSED|nr:hypothetical protein C5U62_22955 [Pseudomonas protegens]
MISVPRDKLKTLIAQCLEGAGGNPDLILEELRALLAKPAEQPAPVAVALPEPSCRQRLAAEGKPYPRSGCAVCGQLSPKWRECDALIEVARLNPPQQ